MFLSCCLGDHEPLLPGDCGWIYFFTKGNSRGMEELQESATCPATLGDHEPPLEVQLLLGELPLQQAVLPAATVPDGQSQLCQLDKTDA